jgi:hypothetical protein
LNTVVAIFSSNISNTVGTGVTLSGDFQCFAHSVMTGTTPASLAQVPGMPIPQSPSDNTWKPLTYNDNDPIVHSFLAAPWNSSYLYSVGDVVTYTSAPAWSNATAYNTGTIVTYMGSQYECLQNSTNNTPKSSPIYWRAYSGVVQYVALMSGTNHQPDTSPTFWQFNLAPSNAATYTSFNVYQNGVFTASPFFGNGSINWLAPGNPTGFKCYFQSGRFSSEWQLTSSDDCRHTDLNGHHLIELRPGTSPCPNGSMRAGFPICLGGDGDGVGIGGDLYLNGKETNGGITFANLGSPSPGQRVWLIDGAVGSDPCAGGGNGTWAETISTSPATFKWVCR